MSYRYIEQGYAPHIPDKHTSRSSLAEEEMASRDRRPDASQPSTSALASGPDLQRHLQPSPLLYAICYILNISSLQIVSTNQL